MLVATVSTKPLDPHGMFMKSCRRYGLSPKVLGVGRPGEDHIPHHKRRFLYKLNILRDYLSVLDASVIVMFTDSWDVFFAGSIHNTDAIYRRIGAEVLFAAERNLWPPGRYDGYPESPTPYRYLNGGGFIGPAGTLLDMLAGCENESVMDQHYWHRVFMRDERIQLDVNCEIFQPLCGHPAYPYDTIPPELECRAGRWCNTLTGSMPIQIHGNGHYDNALKAMWEKMWEKTRQ